MLKTDLCKDCKIPRSNTVIFCMVRDEILRTIPPYQTSNMCELTLDCLERPLSESISQGRVPSLLKKKQNKKNTQGNLVIPISTTSLTTFPNRTKFSLQLITPESKFKSSALVIESHDCNAS